MSDSGKQSTLDDLAIACIRQARQVDAQQLYLKLKEARPELRLEDFADLTERIRAKGLVIVDDSVSLRSFGTYLLHWELSGWFYFNAALVALVLVSLYVGAATLVRWVSGSILLMILPGFTLVQLLLPYGKKHDSLTLFALSVGLSLAVDSFIGLLIALTVGLTMDSTMFTIAVFVISVGLLAMFRQYLKRKS